MRNNETCHQWDNRAFHRHVQHSEVALVLSITLHRDLVNNPLQCFNGGCDIVGHARTCS
jgi:hypothetical protein